MGGLIFESYDFTRAHCNSDCLLYSIPIINSSTFSPSYFIRISKLMYQFKLLYGNPDMTTFTRRIPSTDLSSDLKGHVSRL